MRKGKVYGCLYEKNLYICILNFMGMGNIRKYIKADKARRGNVVNVEDIAGNLSKEDKEKLLSGNGFVKVPAEELKRLRIDVYPYLM